MTAEFAVALPAIALVLAACLGSVHLAVQQVRLTDAAADAARALGRGESVAEARAIADRIAAGASIQIAEDETFVCATLTAAGAGVLAAVQLRAESCAVTGGR